MLEPEGISALLPRLPKYFTAVFASKRNSGKSFFIGCLVKELIRTKKVDLVMVMSGSAGLNDDYDFLPKKLVIPFSEAILKKTWDRQVQASKEHRKHILVVMDDCLSTPEAISSHLVQRIFTLGRHVYISCIVASQVANWLLSPIIKQNSDIILWSKLNRHMLENVYEAMTGIDKKQFIKFAETYGGHDYIFVGFDNFTHCTDPGEFLFLIRA